MNDDFSVLRERPVFICGHPKAGTSLLRAIFDSHPQLVVYPEETVFFRRFLPKSQGLDHQAQLDLADQALIHIFRWNATTPDTEQKDFPGRDYSATPFNQVRSEFHRLVGEQIGNPGKLLSAAVLAYGLVSGQAGRDTRWWVEKSPYNEYFCSQIFTWWPQARCIHIVRDPRDNFASYRRKHPNWAPEFFARNWSRSSQAGQRNLAQYGDDRYIFVRYEDLVNEPEENIHKITSFLQIDWDESLISPTRAGEQWQGNSMFANQFREISSAPLNRWKSELQQLDAAVIELGTGPFFEQFGYLRKASQLSAKIGMLARLKLLTWPLRRKITRKPQISVSG